MEKNKEKWNEVGVDEVKGRGAMKERWMGRMSMREKEEVD